jgi:diacylglycerol kinase (ATP)
VKIVVLVNPRAGTGRGAAASARVGDSLRAAGNEVTILEVESAPDGMLRRSLAGAGALIVVGGDGTVHRAIDPAIDSAVPLWQVPMGTENLFAREQGTFEAGYNLARALRETPRRALDVGRCNGRPFVLMCSIGPDASVIHRMARKRTGAIRRSSYARPIVEELLRPALAPVRVIADGRTMVEGRPGWLVIANSRHYALRLNPARHASPRDGLLDVAFFPAASSLRVAAWMVAVRLRPPGHVSHRAREIVVESPERPLPVQLDGDASDLPLGPGSPLRIRVEPASLMVFAPPVCGRRG